MQNENFSKFIYFIYHFTLEPFRHISKKIPLNIFLKDQRENERWIKSYV
jgi:hypothetical protein